MIFVLKWIFTIFALAVVRGQVEQQMLNKLVCIEHDECGPCLAAASHCRWCADPYYSNARPRCNDDSSLVDTGCSQASIQRPDPSVWEVVSNKSLEDMQLNSHEAVVQIQPQVIRMSLKPRETKKIKFTYRPAKNYPLDLYYLMDLTWSMKDDKETLVSLRDDLPVMLKNLTDNFRLGLGSFAEKPIMPYISVDPRRKANPCTVEEEDCEATYSFKHHLPLTNQVSEFISQVNSSSVTANLDNAEAQLDALVQALTCGTRVGWTPRSRKIIILLSDGLMHTAGDGKLGGATKKNDETCHLDDNGYYADAGIYDYPSVAQVYRLLDKYKVNVIFAVTENVKSHYDQLHELLKDFTYVARLESDSSNILKLVKTGYEDIVSVVNFEDDSDKGPIKVKYFTDCGIEGGPMMERTRCSGVEFGMTVNYEAHLILEACPEYKKSEHTLRISESQLGQDTLVVHVEVHCGCACSHQVDAATLLCPVHATAVCGQCRCSEGWSGPNCDCSISDEAASAALISQCRQPNVTSLPCSGAGECVCGRCECDPGYRGTYCQCKPCTVSLLNGMECGGVGHGWCGCGSCACVAGWRGAACDCSEDTRRCRAPGEAELCGGRGECVCGKCECSVSPEGSRYSGVYCETCSNCENPMCASAEPCVACHLDGSCAGACSLAAANYTVTERYNQTEEESSNEASCIYRREENGFDCEYRYTYTATTKDMVALAIVLREKQCYEPASAKILPIALMIMASIVLGGVIIILFVKSAQIVSDRRAYAMFVKEAEESKKQTHELNPLYISPISEFRLPDSFDRERNF